MDFTKEDIKRVEEDFKNFLTNKDEVMYTYHERISLILQSIPQKGILTYESDGGLFRATLVGEDGNTFYTWWSTEDVLTYSIISAISGMFGTLEKIFESNLALMSGVDLREKFINVINSAMETLQEISEEWDICIT